MKIEIKEHAGFEAARRGISEEFVKFVVTNPQQKISSKKGRIIVQNRYDDKSENKEMLIRIIGTETSDMFSVITVYKTSKIAKYWVKEVER